MTTLRDITPDGPRLVLQGLSYMNTWTGCGRAGENPDCRIWRWTAKQVLDQPINVACVLVAYIALRQLWPQLYLRFRIWRIRAEIDTRSSRFMRAWEAYRAGLFAGKGFYLGDFWSRWEVVRSACVPGSASIMTVGGAGRRKGSGLVIPNVLRYSYQVCVDFSGEIAAVTKSRLEQLGYRVVCINPVGEHLKPPHDLGQARFNPLVGIDPRSPKFGALCRGVAESCINRSGKESDPHWANSAVASIDFLTREHITRAKQLGKQANLVSVILELTSGNQEHIFARMTKSDDKFIASEGAAMLERRKQSPKEFSGVISNIASNLAWLKEHSFERSLTGHDIDYDELAGRGKCKGYIVFICLPLDQAESHSAWLKLVLNSIISELIRRRPKQRILFTLDEASVLGGWIKIKQALAYLRKFNMQFHLIYHSLGEVQNLFGDSYHSMMANSYVKNFVGVNDRFTAEELSKMLGERAWYDEMEGEKRETLLPPDQILQLREDAQISLVSAGRPIWIVNRPYFHRPLLRRGLTQNPYYEVNEYPNIPALYLVWSVKGAIQTWAATMRPRASEITLGTLILGGVACAMFL